MSDVIIRAAKKSDAADLAILDNLAGHSLPVPFWLEQTESGRLEDAIALGRERLADNDGFYNWKKAKVAVEDETVLGMSICYVMPEPNEEYDAIKESFEPFKPILDLHDYCIGHWYIDALAIYPSAQQKGVGKLLFNDAIARGEVSSSMTMSLIVEDTNTIAFALYRSCGFEVVAQKDFIPFEGSLEINEWLLMSRVIS